MKTKVHFQSILVGFVAGAVLMLALGAAYPQGAIGRFQIGGDSQPCSRD